MITEYRDVTDKTTVEQIDWNNIRFLTAVSKEGQLIIQAAENVTAFRGYGVILAYCHNFIRVVQMFGGHELIEQMPKQLLWDIGLTLASGNPVPLTTMTTTNEENNNEK